MADDNVNHPLHYTNGDIECIDAIKASMTTSEFYGYLKGNVIKYLWRYQLKDDPIQDLKKAQWYLERLIEENSRYPLRIAKYKYTKSKLGETIDSMNANSEYANPSQEDCKGAYEKWYERDGENGVGERRE